MRNSELKQDLEARLSRYVQIYTTSDAESQSQPSTARQLDLSRLLVSELLALGLRDAELDPHGYVYASLPARGGSTAPAIGLLAHVDTSPQVTGEHVRPQVHRHYDGGTLVINAAQGLTLSPATCPVLAEHLGHDIMTASGDTLLGADNKAGVAIIMSLLTWLQAHPELPHRELRIAFTVDEEIGRGVVKFDVKRFGAQYAYTLDGDTLGSLEYECFNADGFELVVHGRSIHPGTSRNTLANAVRIAAELVAAWPPQLLPESTLDREGFLMVGELHGDVEKAVIKGIVRDHELAKLYGHEDTLRCLIRYFEQRHPLARFELRFKEQYRNMRQVIEQHPAVLEDLLAAYRAAGVTPRIKPIRGGTDGARLSFMGLPTPNIFTGGTNYHAKDEWVSLDSMVKAVDVLLALASKT